MADRRHDNSRKTVVQFYNRLNLGDDLLVHLLVSRSDGIFSMPRTTGSTLADRPNVKMIERPGSGLSRRLRSTLSRRPASNHSELSTAARSHDALIHIGGSIFIEHEGALDFWKKEVEYYESLPVPYFIVDANFGPFRSPDFPHLVRRILEGAADVCLRDKESYDRFSDLPHVRIAPDAGFTVNPTPSARTFDAVFSVMDLAITHGEDLARSYERACGGALRELLQEGKTVCLMSFCDFQGDHRAAERIRAIADPSGRFSESVSVYSYRGDLDEAIGILSSAGVIFGTRFHAIVIGIALGIPTLPIVYSMKTTHMLDEIGLSGARADLVSGDLPASLNDLGPSVLPPTALAALRARADQQFLGVDKYFGTRAS
ncbi:MAG: polysaccharide pyruvyl transferase family protein [Beijerinckiaceae bacterium]|nr:polysaccharide pyruvyl transferase family protein [Beijerinckiaceae bacterium]